ncbi:hypothetical protein OAO01_09310, partial [Oligoflexia bacterium]|nr:hypothetical protein [Oligoflexia bacterium]
NYCILNQQYSKNDYEQLAAKIVQTMLKDGTWGELFPPSISPFAYNDTVAEEYFPLPKADSANGNFKWRAHDQKDYIPQTYDLPDAIRDVPDTVVSETLACQHCTRNFRIIQQELGLYRKTDVPLPRICPTCRHLKRLMMRNPRTLWERPCDKCQTALLSTYAAGRRELVYCEKCYLEEVHE